MTTPFVSFERDQLTRGLKSVNIPSYAYTGLALGGGPLTTTDEAYQTVPYLYRACTLRANTVAAIPYSILSDGEELEEHAQIDTWLTNALYMAELSRVLYGAAYFLIEANRFNENITPRYIPRAYVSPAVDPVNGVTGFRVSFVSESIPFDKMIYIWEPNPASEVAPGPAPAYVALQAAGVLGALDAMASQYFRNGAVPITAVKVPPSAGKEERAELKTWFQRFASGLRNAFGFLPVSQGTEFETIGATLKDSQASELTDSQRINVAVGLGVPPTLLNGNSANYATANSEMMGFYLHTVIPSAKYIQQKFNTQLFERMGLELRFDFDKLEIMQAQLLEQAQAVSELTGGKAIISVNEARGLLEMEEVPGGDWKEESTTVTPPPQFGAASTASLPAPVAEPDDDEEQIKAWMTASLTLYRAGSGAAVGTPFDAELTGASSANHVKRIYSAHWPKSTPATWQERAVSELARYNTLAEGAKRNG